MRIINCEQRTPEWYACRTGLVTASSFSKIMTTKGKRSGQREAYLKLLAEERRTGIMHESVCTNNMSRGICMEDEALACLAMVMDLEIEKVGFCLADNGLYGCSPDGLISNSGCEAKCPSLAVHRGYLRSGKLPSCYLLQVHGSMLVTGAKHWYFISYHPDAEPLILDVKRDDRLSLQLRHELDIFCAELDKIQPRKEALPTCDRDRDLFPGY